MRRLSVRATVFGLGVIALCLASPAPAVDASGSLTLPFPTTAYVVTQTYHTPGGYDLVPTGTTVITAAMDGAATSFVEANCNPSDPAYNSPPCDDGICNPGESYGRYVIIDHGGGLQTVYAHLASFSISNGAVTRGQAIGIMGRAGCAEGAIPPTSTSGRHLHFEVRTNGTRVDPGNPSNCSSSAYWTTCPASLTPPATAPLSALGLLKSNGAFVAKQGALDAGWVALTGAARAIATNGDRFAFVQMDGQLYGKDGIAGEWVLLAGAAESVALSHDRIGVVETDGDALVKDGLYGDWVMVAGGIDSIALAGDRIAILQRDGSVRAKDGIFGDWITEAGGAQAISLDDNRIGVLLTDGTLVAKDGISAGWTTLGGGIKSFSLGGGLVVAVRSDDVLIGKSGLSGDWVTLGGGICTAAVGGSWISAIANDGTVLAKNTLMGEWVVEEGGGVQVAVSEGASSGISDQRDVDCDDRLNASDNCPTTSNPDQSNTDAAPIANPPYVPIDTTVANSDAAGDACDSNDDNDGLPDTDESGLTALQAVCPQATGATSPVLVDTDGDRVGDGAECALGSDPASAASKPATPAPGTDADGDGLSDAYEGFVGSNPNAKDTDGDGLQDGWEVKGYNTSPIDDSDGDGVRDGCEVASINSDTVVNPGDQALLSAEIMRAVPQSQKLANFDLNKDGAINPGDQAFQASKVGAGKCP